MRLLFGRSYRKCVRLGYIYRKCMRLWYMVGHNYYRKCVRLRYGGTYREMCENNIMLYDKVTES